MGENAIGVLKLYVKLTLPIFVMAVDRYAVVSNGSTFNCLETNPLTICVPVTVAGNPALFVGIFNRDYEPVPFTFISTIVIDRVHILSEPVNPDPTQVPDTGIFISGAFANFWLLSACIT